MWKQTGRAQLRAFDIVICNKTPGVMRAWHFRGFAEFLKHNVITAYARRHNYKVTCAAPSRQSLKNRNVFSIVLYCIVYKFFKVA